MSERPDGGTAFPFDGIQKPGSCEGMSLRDYFAGQALIGIHIYLASTQPGNGDDETMAQWAYNVADSMLNARERK